MWPQHDKYGKIGTAPKKPPKTQKRLRRALHTGGRSLHQLGWTKPKLALVWTTYWWCKKLSMHRMLKLNWKSSDPIVLFLVAKKGASMKLAATPWLLWWIFACRQGTFHLNLQHLPSLRYLCVAQN